MTPPLLLCATASPRTPAPPPGYDDEPRALTERRHRPHARGRGRGMAALGLGVDAVVSSPLVRCRQTGEIVAARTSGWRPGPGSAPAARASTSTALDDLLLERPDAAPCCSAGTQPDLSIWSPSSPRGGRCDFRKGSLAVLASRPAGRGGARLRALYDRRRSPQRALGGRRRAESLQARRRTRSGRGAPRPPSRRARRRRRSSAAPPARRAAGADPTPSPARRSPCAERGRRGALDVAPSASHETSSPVERGQRGGVACPRRVRSAVEPAGRRRSRSASLGWPPATRSHPRRRRLDRALEQGQSSGDSSARTRPPARRPAPSARSARSRGSPPSPRRSDSRSTARSAIVIATFSETRGVESWWWASTSRISRIQRWLAVLLGVLASTRARRAARAAPAARPSPRARS